MTAGAINVVCEELTNPAVEHDALVARDFAVSLASVLLCDGAADRALVVILRNGAALGVLHGDNRWTDLDGLPLGAVGAALLRGDDATIAASASALLKLPLVDLEIVRGAGGACVGLVAIAGDVILPAARSGRALARAAAALGAWTSAGTTADGAALALIDRIDHAVIVHDHDLVLAANRAAAKLLGHARADALVGVPLASLFPRMPRLPFFAAELGAVRADRQMIRVCTREHALVLGGRGLRALLIEEANPSDLLPGIELAPIVDAVMSELLPTLRRCARVSVTRGSRPLVAAEADTLRDVVSLAVLDVASFLDEQAAGTNRLDIGILERPDGDVCVEVTGTGSLVQARCPAEPIGAALTGIRVGALGGDLEMASTGNDRRVLRLVLPRGFR
jgi:PAS domain-containing protein